MVGNAIIYGFSGGSVKSPWTRRVTSKVTFTETPRVPCLILRGPIPPLPVREKGKADA